MIEKKKKQLEELRSERDCLAENSKYAIGKYAIDLTLSNNRCIDINVYH
jgi:hypothetical protein